MSFYPTMLRTLTAFLVASALLAGASGCSKEEAPPPGPVVKKIAPKPAQGAPPPPKAAAEEKKAAAPAAPVYSPEGRRDPFVSFAKNEAEKVKDERSSLPPLQRYELGELKMVGVIWGKRGAKALVEDAEGKGYTVQVGDRIGRSGGVVSKIDERQITVREEFPGAGGRKVSRESTLQLTTAGGNQ